MKCTRRAHSFWTTCACPPCQLDRRRTAKLARTGRLTRVPNRAAWAVIDDLVAAGWTGRAIASAAGLPRRTIEGALVDLRTTGRRTKFGPTTAAAIVGHGEPTEGLVGVYVARRYLQGLAHTGWDLRTLAARGGIGESTLASIRGGNTNQIGAALNARIRALAEDIGIEVGPSIQARQNAARKGWASLFAWDNIDDLNERPKGVNRGDYPVRAPDVIGTLDPARVERILAGDFGMRCTPVEKAEVCRRWYALGRSLNELGRLTGWRVDRYFRLEDGAA